jgi:hypothetical protein
VFTKNNPLNSFNSSLGDSDVRYQPSVFIDLSSNPDSILTAQRHLNNDSWGSAEKVFRVIGNVPQLSIDYGVGYGFVGPSNNKISLRSFVKATAIGVGGNVLGSVSEDIFCYEQGTSGRCSAQVLPANASNNTKTIPLPSYFSEAAFIKVQVEEDGGWLADGGGEGLNIRFSHLQMSGVEPLTPEQ